MPFTSIQSITRFMSKLTSPFSRLAAGLVALSLVLSLSSNASAATITVNGNITTAASSAYTVGQSVSFTFTTANTLGAPNASDQSNLSDWSYNSAGNPRIFSAVTGTSLTGTWTDTPNGGDPWSEVYVSRSDGEMQFIAATDNASLGTGLQIGSRKVQIVQAAFKMPGGSLPSFVAASLVDTTLPIGTFTVSTPQNGDFSRIYTTNGEDNRFNVTSVTYSVDVAPEPSRMMLLGLACGLGLLRRRRRSC